MSKLIIDVKAIKDRIARLKEKCGSRPPEELVALLDVNRRRALLSAVGQDKLEKRLFSPMIKNMLPNDIIPDSAPFTSAEKDTIKYVAKVLHKYYGEPKFQYSGNYDNDCVSVKMGQALLRISPKVTAGASVRRYENLQKYFTDYTFKPNARTLQQAVDIFLQLANLPKVKQEWEVKYVKGLFAQHSSNVGYPFFANETSTIDGQTYRDKTVELTKQLNDKYGFGGMTAVPAVIIGRDQSGGIDFDLNRKLTYNELVKEIDKFKYKPSKARVVGAVDRISNNNYNTVLKPLIEHPQFKKSPMFCGFVSREDRYLLYKRFDKMVKDKKLIPINIDYSSFDTTTSPEMMLLAMDIIKDAVFITGVDNNELYEALAAKAIFTKYTVFNPTKRILEHGSKNGAIPSGLGWTGIMGVIIAQVAGIYGLIEYYGRDYVTQLVEGANEYNTFAQTGLGDDALGTVKAFSDLKPIANIIRDAFGLDISVESTKTAVGVDFLQELFGDDKILYPAGRVIDSALYTEKKSGLGGAQGVIKGSSQLGNMRQNAELIDIAAWINKFDGAHLGLFNPRSGAKVTAQQFLDQLKVENSEEGKSTRDKTHNGNPAYDVIYQSDGEIESYFLHGARDVALKSYDRAKRIPNISDPKGGE